MRINRMLPVALLALAAPHAQAAVKDYAVKCRTTIVEDDRRIHQTRRQAYGFRVEILGDNGNVKPEDLQGSRPFVTAEKGERYSVRLYNPLPVRVAVNLTVDGLNSITGKPSGIEDGKKWIIDPYGSVTIPGWQVSGGEARRFFFTDKPKSYAKWRGDNLGKDLAANCGVIGAAYFWDQGELDRYWDDHPTYHYPHRALDMDRAKKSMALPAPACSQPMPGAQGMNGGQPRDRAEKEQAGTGMGESQYNPTVEVDFHYDAGMYSPDQAVVIYYDFAPVQAPNPFPALGYAPEMP